MLNLPKSDFAHCIPKTSMGTPLTVQGNVNYTEDLILTLKECNSRLDLIQVALTGK